MSKKISRKELLTTSLPILAFSLPGLKIIEDLPDRLFKTNSLLSKRFGKTAIQYDQSYFEGFVFNGKRLYGILKFDDQEFKGWFKNDRPAQGTVSWKLLGDRFTGSISENGFPGYGIYSFANGQRFEGTFQDNHFQEGILKYPDGSIYHGKFHFDGPEFSCFEGIQVVEDKIHFHPNFESSLYDEKYYLLPDGQKFKIDLEKFLTESEMSADVVISDSSSGQFTIALAYDRDLHSAPILVAKGKDDTALSILNIAKKNNIPIVVNSEIASLMYKQVELYSTIPVKFYHPISVILAKLNKYKRSVV